MKLRKPSTPSPNSEICTKKDKFMDAKEILDHQFVVAAYTVTWVIQLGYLAWLGLKWRTQRRKATRKADNSR